MYFLKKRSSRRRRSSRSSEVAEQVMVVVVVVVVSPAGRCFLFAARRARGSSGRHSALGRTLIRASEETSRTVVFCSLEGKREGHFWPDRPEGVTFYPAPPLLAAPPCAAPCAVRRPARTVSGFWIRQVQVIEMSPIMPRRKLNTKAATTWRKDSSHHVYQNDAGKSAVPL